MTEFEKYIQRYLNLIPSENWLEEMKIVCNQTLEFYQSLTEEQSNFAYAEGKWTLKTLLEHLTDIEKIFHYRALRFARKDTTDLALVLMKISMLKTEQQINRNYLHLLKNFI